MQWQKESTEEYALKAGYQNQKQQPVEQINTLTVLKFPETNSLIPQ